ncbi:LysR family transcriptional regulator [Verrucomicrobiaceae bacterium N1E253]|uniref:LysR family transcriptional regulator n=1 Tax=Oceaniferula marina TaxID=2748318 RepID=A0A851GH03_9BACT|nr:LysR family transcriptional regulator [Oceaniferula marina]NWK57068.1 LysR family transcriptional regulator [Oceaniferula marina]
MNMEHLRHFVEVCHDMNISAAAKRLRLTQPALSRQMAVFENDTGWSLFDRGPKSIQLTRAGEVVKRLGEEMLAQVDRIELQMQREVDGEEIRVGYAPSLGGALLQQAMGRFAQMHARVRITIADSTSEEMISGLRDGRFDLVIGVSSGEVDIDWTTLRRESFALAVPREHALSRKRVVKASELDQTRLLLLSRVDYPGYWQEVSTYFKQQGINAKVAGEFDGVASLRLGVEAGLGVALVAESARMGKEVRIKKVEPKPDPICVGVGCLLGRALEPWVEAFVEELKWAAR